MHAPMSPAEYNVFKLVENGRTTVRNTITTELVNMLPESEFVPMLNVERFSLLSNILTEKFSTDDLKEQLKKPVNDLGQHEIETTFYVFTKDQIAAIVKSAKEIKPKQIS